VVLSRKGEGIKQKPLIKGENKTQARRQKTVQERQAMLETNRKILKRKIKKEKIKVRKIKI
jgi:hypothetical protein